MQRHPTWITTAMALFAKASATAQVVDNRLGANRNTFFEAGRKRCAGVVARRGVEID